MTGTDLEVAAPRALVGKIASALSKLEDGIVVDPDQRRAPGAAKYHRERLTESTRRAYLRWIRVYLAFCERMGRIELPASDLTLEHFMVYLAELDPSKGKNSGKPGVGMAPASMRQALSAVRSFHDAAREPFPSTRPALGIIEGHGNRRARPDSGVKDDEGVPPIKLPTLLELIRACPVDTNAGLRDRALLSTGFTIMARRAELSIIDHDSVVALLEGDIRVTIRQTKTNRLKGRVAYLPAWDDYPECCPVRAVQAWRSRCAELGITSGPFFRGVDKWDHVHGTAVYAGPPAAAGVRLSPQTVELVIARAALAAIRDSGAEIPNAAALRAHSLRAGGVTSGYEAGADILSLSRQGGWADNSPVIFRYIREVDLQQRNPMRLVGNPSRNVS